MDAEKGAARVQSVITLEPCCGGKGGGKSHEWVDWFLRENYNGECLTFGYAQAGQENSFGWQSIEAGFTYQCEQFEKLQNEGKITLETLGETGSRYKSTYDMTPASAITAHSAYDDPNKNSVWYSSKQYRVNLYGDGGKMRIRDLHIFSEKHPDPFENTVCTSDGAVYETLPLTDGNRFTGNGIVGGLYIVPDSGIPFTHTEMVFTDNGDNCANVGYGRLSFTLKENSLSVCAPEGFGIENRIGKENNHTPSVVSLTDRAVILSYHGTQYKVTLTSGHFADAKTVISENNTVTAEFSAL